MSADFNSMVFILTTIKALQAGEKMRRSSVERAIFVATDMNLPHTREWLEEILTKYGDSNKYVQTRERRYAQGCPSEN